MTNTLLRNGLFGTLFTDRDVAEAYSAAAQLGHMMTFEIAWTRGLIAVGAVSGEDGAAALDALARFEPSGLHPTSDRDGLPVPSLVAQLRRGLAPGVAKAIHTGATSQDVLDTAFVLTSIGVIERLDQRLTHMLSTLTILELGLGTCPLLRAPACRPRFRRPLRCASTRGAVWWPRRSTKRLRCARCCPKFRSAARLVPGPYQSVWQSTCPKRLT